MRDLPPLNPQDLDWIAQCIGRPATPVLHVAARRADGRPAVIVNHPLKQTPHRPPQPFPTLYWLICPDLVRQIADLERRGLIRQAEARLQDDPALLAQLHTDHERYIRQRWSVLTPQDRAAIRAAGLDEMFNTCGIAGLRDWSTVKCLHAHYAQFLADDNALGRWLDPQIHS